MNPVLRAGILIGVSALFISCDLAKKAPAPDALPLVAPASNEIYVSGTDRLTISEYETLHRVYPTLAPDEVVRLALDSQWLAKSWRPHENADALKDATRCVRATLSPPVSDVEKRDTTMLLNRAFGIENLTVLASRLKESRQNRTVEWNPTLVKEYRLQAKP